MTGPGGTAATGCEIHDFDRDGDVDTADFALFERVYTGAGGTSPYYLRMDAVYFHDSDGDRDVDPDDYASLASCVDSPEPDATCLGIHDYNQYGISDGRVAVDDFGGFSACFSGDGVMASEECLRSAFEAQTPESGDFSLHGRPVDVLADGKVLTYVRARFYDAKHGRWLQRDPTGNVDGANLYEAFGSNPSTFTDPMGLYYKLWSTWENGAELYWQDISPIVWRLTKEVSDEFSLGQYQYIDGHKFVMYRGAVENDPLDPALYIIPFEVLEGWAKQDISLKDYERFVFRHGIPIGRTGEVLKRDLLNGGLTQGFMALQDEQEQKFKEFANWATTPYGARTVEMLLSGGVDPITERNMTGREIREHIVRVVDTGLMMYGGGQLLTAETGAMTAAGGRSAPIGTIPGEAHMPVTGSQWYESLAARYGAENVSWARLPEFAGGKTTGVLRTAAGEFHLLSGRAGPAALMPGGSPGMNIVTKTHVEGHTAAIMRQLGLDEGMLFINRLPCGGAPGCGNMLPLMLPPGAQLRVVGPNGYNQIFIGLPD
jgi:RHS repeat-associated protein